MVWLWLATALIGIVSFVGLRIYSHYRKVSHIPGHWQVTSSFWRLPVISPHLHFNAQHSVTELMDQYGDKDSGIVRVSSMDRNVVIINDKDLLKEVIVAKGSIFTKFTEVYEVFKVFGENILTVLDASSESWKNHHKICTPAFTTQNLEYLCEYAVKSVDTLFKTRWEKLKGTHTLKNGETYQDAYLTSDIKGDFSDVTLDVLGQVGFGLDFEIFKEQTGTLSDGQIFRKSLEVLFTTGIFVKLFIGMSRIWSFLFPLAQKIFKVDVAYNVVSSKLDEILKQRTDEIEKSYATSGEIQTGERRDLLSCLIEANYVQKGVLTPEEVKSDSFIFSLAGHETTSTTLQWTCYELGKRPEILKKAQEEVDRVLENGARTATYDDFPNMNYVNMVIMESLRVHPPVIATYRVAKKATTLGKYHIPKDTIIQLEIANTHWNEKFWENANDFSPSRYPQDFEQRQKVHTDFTWVPFSMGNRKCIGYKFAQYEAFAIMSRILQLYDIKLVNDERLPEDQVTEEKGPTVGPGNLHLLFTKRKAQ